MIRSAKEAERKWVKRDGNVLTPGRKDLTITAPILEYLNRKDARGIPYFELKNMDRYFLEKFLEHALDHIGGGIGILYSIHILIDRDPTQKELPEDLVGIIHANWWWPDPRRILSLLEYTIIEANGLDLYVEPVTESELPHELWIDPDFRDTINGVSQIPPLPPYPIFEEPQGGYNVRREAWSIEVPIFEKMRAAVAATAAGSSAAS
jgi:hypothetical protein